MSNTEVRARLEKALLMDWFRKIGASLSDEDYEAGIEAIAQHEAAIRHDQIAKDAQIIETLADRRAIGRYMDEAITALRAQIGDTNEQ